MMYKKQGLEGKCARQYVNCDVTSLFRHLLYVALRLEAWKAGFDSVNRVYSISSVTLRNSGGVGGGNLYY